jgi:hypothetical protein
MPTLPCAIAGLTITESNRLGGIMSTPVPTIGRIVHYKLSEADAEQVNRRREDAHRHYRGPVGSATIEFTGDQRHIGNRVQEGDVYPMLIVRTWGSTPESAVNGQVFLDGNDVLWVTSVGEGEGSRRFVWPTRS